MHQSNLNGNDYDLWLLPNSTIRVQITREEGTNILQYCVVGYFVL